MSIVFGPIPSRRLGRSLGINNIPPKTCSYSCVYCQVGLTNNLTITTRSFLSPNEIVKEVKRKLNKIKSSSEKVDYITFVPDGEPLIDINLGITIEKLKAFGIKIAVITNSSFLFNESVRDEIRSADWVSLKVDSAVSSVWKKINRPHGSLKFSDIIEGILNFSTEYEGELVTETMLVNDMNDNLESIIKTANLVKMISPQKAYILIPTRPPAEKWVKAPDEDKLNSAYQIFSEINIPINLLIQNEGIDFTYFSDPEKEILNILAVHPMRREAVEKFLLKAKTNWNLIESLLNNKVLREVYYAGNRFIIKNFKSNKN